MNQSEIIIAAIAIGFITIGLFHLEKANRLKKKGKKAKAIILPTTIRNQGLTDMANIILLCVL